MQAEYKGTPFFRGDICCGEWKLAIIAQISIVNCISGLPLYELTTPANTADSAVIQEILAATKNTLPLCECTFLGDMSYDAKTVYNLAKDVYQGEAFIPLNKHNTKSLKKLPGGNPIYDAISPCTRTEKRLMSIEDYTKSYFWLTLPAAVRVEVFHRLVVTCAVHTQKS